VRGGERKERREKIAPSNARGKKAPKRTQEKRRGGNPKAKTPFATRGGKVIQKKNWENKGARSWGDRARVQRAPKERLKRRS